MTTSSVPQGSTSLCKQSVILSLGEQGPAPWVDHSMGWEYALMLAGEGRRQGLSKTSDHPDDLYARGFERPPIRNTRTWCGYLVRLDR